MAHDQTDRPDRRAFLQAGALATASALSATSGHGDARCPRQGDDTAQAKAGQDRPRDHHARDGHGGAPRARRPRTLDPAVLRQRRPHVRHRQDVRHRARLQEVVRAVTGGSQGDRPGHQGQSRAPKEMLAMLDKRLEALGDRLRRPVFHPRPGRRPQASTTPSTSSSHRNSKRRPTRSASRARPSSSASRPTTRIAPRSSRRRPTGGIIDAIMLQYTPWLDKDEPLNKALDACHKKGIGLISMKQVAGQFPLMPTSGHPRRGRQAGPDAGREEAEPVPGPAARDLDRRADQRLVRVDQDDRSAS